MRQLNSLPNACGTFLIITMAASSLNVGNRAGRRQFYRWTRNCRCALLERLVMKVHCECATAPFITVITHLLAPNQ
jgi:hypothetical protein